MGKDGFEIRVKMSGDWKKQVEKAAADAIKKDVESRQRMLDQLGRTYKDRPVLEIKPALRAAWKKLGGDLKDPELTAYAQHISDGTRIVLNPRTR